MSSFTKMKGHSRLVVIEFEGSRAIFRCAINNLVQINYLENIKLSKQGQSTQ